MPVIMRCVESQSDFLMLYCFGGWSCSWFLEESLSETVDYGALRKMRQIVPIHYWIGFRHSHFLRSCAMLHWKMIVDASLAKDLATWVPTRSQRQPSLPRSS